MTREQKLEQALREVRSHFDVELDDDGRTAAIGYDSKALQKVVRVLDAALSHEGEARACSDASPLTVDSLARKIRSVDGENSLGAGLLAEALMPFIMSTLSTPKVEALFLPCEDGEVNGNEIEARPISDIVPDRCTSTSLAFSEGVLCVKKDGSGYIAVDEQHWELEDDRSEGPDGPEGSIHWITRFPSGELEVLRDFLNGVPIDTSPAPTITDEAVERAAKAIHDGPLGANDEEDFGDNNASDWCREVARAALLAAFPSRGGE